MEQGAFIDAVRIFMACRGVRHWPDLDLLEADYSALLDVFAGNLKPMDIIQALNVAEKWENLYHELHEQQPPAAV